MAGTADIQAAREGDLVVAQDGALGQVDRIVRSDADGPVYFVVSVGPILRRRYPVLHRTLVTGVDRRRGKMYVRGHRRSLERLSESPLSSSEASMKAPVSKLVGYSVMGRHGFLGTVVGNDSPSGQPAEETIVFRGGISDSLLFHLPAARLRSISPSRRTVTVEVDVGDFVPRPGKGGTVELHIVH